jgi:carbon monoxide dehydrogenase subunit G
VAFRIEESFSVAASPERVWKWLIDPGEVVRCLPGAELLEIQDARNFVGRVKVRVGPIVSSYRGKASFTELDAETRTIAMTGQGQEISGGGSARMTMTSRVIAADGGGSDVRVDVEVDVVGKIVQFGRGMIEEVSRQIFRQFAECAAGVLAEADDAGGTAPMGDPDDAPAADAQDTAPLAGASSGPPAPATATASPGRPPPPAKPVNGLALLLRAVLARLRRLFGGSA